MSGTREHPIEHPFAYGDTYFRERLGGGSERLRIGLRDDHPAILCRLAAALEPPYRILYLLHTSRTDAPLGGYESPDLERAGVEAVISRFGDFFASDARHDVWVHSMTDGGTVVLDRYNLIYAYGPLEQFEQILRIADVSPVASWAAPMVPRPHALHYHEEWDNAERGVVAALAWTLKPLRPGDVQHWSGPTAS